MVHNVVLRVLCATFFVKEFPRFGRLASANFGKSRLKSAKNRPKFDPNSTENRQNSQLKSTKWGLFISHLRWWERTPQAVVSEFEVQSVFENNGKGGEVNSDPILIGGSRKVFV